MPEASIGRIVHFGHAQGCRPAQIVAVFDQGSGPPLLNLVVTLDGRNDSPEGDLHSWQTSVPHADRFSDDSGVYPKVTPDTWHWPEQIPQTA